MNLYSLLGLVAALVTMIVIVGILVWAIKSSD